MHSRERVLARWQPTDFKVSASIADCEKRIRGYVYICLHPRVLVALEGHHHFGSVKRGLDGSALGHLGHVPLRIAGSFRLGVHIVHGWVAIEYAQRLAGYHCKHVRVVTAALLIEDRRGRGDCELLSFKSLFDIHVDIPESALVHNVLLTNIRLLG